MPGKQKSTRPDLCADTLGDAKNDAADQRPP